MLYTGVASNLKSRIWTNHLHGNGGNSTLRKTLGSLFGYQKIARDKNYQINKKTHGFYVIFYYKAESSVVSTLEAAFKLNDNVLRWMTLVDYPMSEIVYDQNQVQTSEEITPIDAEDAEVE